MSAFKMADDVCREVVYSRPVATRRFVLEKFKSTDLFRSVSWDIGGGIGKGGCFPGGTPVTLGSVCAARIVDILWCEQVGFISFLCMDVVQV